MQARLERISRYPVRGLTGQVLDSVVLSAGRPLPEDRRFALVYSGGDTGRPLEEWLAQATFASLTREERLAALELVYEADSATVTLLRAGRQVARGRGDQDIGRTVLTQFFSAFLKDGARGPVRFVEAPDGGFTHWDEHLLHLINPATARDLERVARKPVDPRRFRANLWLDGLEAWTEMDWVGRRLRLGEALLEVVDKTERCAATAVNPDTAERDLNVPRILRAGYGHLDMGIYLRVLEGGRIAVGDPAELV